MENYKLSSYLITNLSTLLKSLVLDICNSIIYFIFRFFILISSILLFLGLFSSISARESSILTLDDLKVYDLNGTFEFSPKDDESFKSFASESTSHTIKVPGQWHLLELPENIDRKSLSTVWYRRQIRINDIWKRENISIRIPIIADAHEVYFNGERIGSRGVIGETIGKHR